MEFIDVNLENIGKENICCALSSKDGRAESKKNWMKDRFDDGLVFKKLNERGKVFIEYIPLENSFSIIEGDNYIHINCLWVSGKFKGQGYGSSLLHECIKDSRLKGRRGIVALAGKTKKPFLSDGDFLKAKGFKIAETMEPYYELLYINFDEDDENRPRFIRNENKYMEDVVIYYSNQCPHTCLYVELIENISEEKNMSVRTIKFENKEDARKSPSPFTTYSLFLKGEFITNEIISERKFIKLIEEKL